MSFQHPGWGDSTSVLAKTPIDSAQQKRHLVERQRSVGERQQQLRINIRQSTDRLRHPAEIEEELASKRKEVIGLEKLRSALELARHELTESTQEFQKQFAPNLEKSIGGSLGRVTAGRYSAIRIDPITLSVDLNLAERDDVVAADRLSTGTRDLVYLMLRVGVAELMSSHGERLPLMLDDALVHFDRNRYVRTLEYLLELASETQILLFTKDEWTSDWFLERIVDGASHKLHIL